MLLPGHRFPSSHFVNGSLLSKFLVKPVRHKREGLCLMRSLYDDEKANIEIQKPNIFLQHERHYADTSQACVSYIIQE